MPILFSAVSHKSKVLWKFASCDGNFNEITELLLSKLSLDDCKMTYSHGSYLLHHIVKDKYVYLCITDKQCQRSRAFLFLNEIQRRFQTQTSKDFTDVLASEMYRYSEDYNTIIVRKGELDEINSIGVGSSESLLGEKILYIKNPDNISYSTITNITKTPERILSVNSFHLYVAIAVLIIGVTIYMLYLYMKIGPISYAVITSIGIYSLIRYIVKSDKS